MDKTKLTREEALRRWKASKETKRKMVEKLENLVRNSCLERTGKEPNGVEVWQYLEHNRALLQFLSENCKERQMELSWEEKAKVMVEWYKKVFENPPVLP